MRASRIAAAAGVIAILGLAGSFACDPGASISAAELDGLGLGGLLTAFVLLFLE